VKQRTSREALQQMARGRRCWLLIVALLATAAGPRPSFYDPPSLATHHHPGDILRTEPVPGAPAGSTATRMLYMSTTPNGREVAVSALVIVPSGAAPAQGRPVLAWLHPTTGVARNCAPTLGPDPFGQIQGLSAFLAAGDVVVATDYPGLGGPGVPPYLVGVSEARSALDAVRAVQHVPGAQAGRRFAAWGHSQGGQAALFAADIAASYAPELELVGVAAAAPVTNLTALIEQPQRNPLWAPLLSYTVWSWSHVFGLAPDAIMPPAAHGTVERTARGLLANRTGAEAPGAGCRTASWAARRTADTVGQSADGERTDAVVQRRAGHAGARRRRSRHRAGTHAHVRAEAVQRACAGALCRATRRRSLQDRHAQRRRGRSVACRSVRQGSGAG
jgi:hypothetical protein